MAFQDEMQEEHTISKIQMHHINIYLDYIFCISPFSKNSLNYFYLLKCFEESYFMFIFQKA